MFASVLLLLLLLRLLLLPDQGASAEVYLHGAHVVSWKDASGKVRAEGDGGDMLADTPAGRTAPACHPCILCAALPLQLSSTPPQDVLFTSRQAVFQPPKAIRWVRGCGAKGHHSFAGCPLPLGCPCL